MSIFSWVTLFLIAGQLLCIQSFKENREFPNAPDITYVRCNQSEAVFSWRSKGDNGAPILNYVIEYSTALKPGQWDVISEVPAKTSFYKVNLAPWSNSTFRVKAVNKIGASPPARHFVRCTTAPDVPYRNPNDVEVIGSTPGSLVISWTLMIQAEHNGPGFSYGVLWKRDVSGSQYERRDVTDWTQNSLVIDNLVPSTRYFIKVVAKNELGEASATAEDVVGYSG